MELFPFSFTDYLRFQEKPIPNLDRMTTVERAQLKAAMNTYLYSGGILDTLKYLELPLLRTLYVDVLYRNIASRYRIDAVTALKELAFYLISNPAGLVSFNKLKKQVKLGSVNTISSYIEYLENSWLIFALNLYDFPVKRQQIAPKKIFSIDTGLSNTIFQEGLTLRHLYDYGTTSETDVRASGARAGRMISKKLAGRDETVI